MSIKHFLTLLDLSGDQLRELMARAGELKQWQREGRIFEPLKHKMLAMVFEKSSTRTRVSFETGMVQLGGHAMFLSPRDTQIGRGEPVEDSARVLSRMVDAIMIRTFEHEKVELLARYSAVPVINALTDQYHPCQLLADMLTWFERRGDIQGATVAFIGDGNNMCHSYINAARQFDFRLNIAAPEGYLPDPDIIAAAGDRVALFERRAIGGIQSIVRQAARRDQHALATAHAEVTRGPLIEARAVHLQGRRNQRASQRLRHGCAPRISG